MLEVQPLTTETMEWDAFVRSTPQGSPFHLMAWKRAVEATFGHRSHYLMAVRGSTLEGVLPLFEIRGLLGGRGPRIRALRGLRRDLRRPRRRRVRLWWTRPGLWPSDAARHTWSCDTAQVRSSTLPTKSLYVTFSRPISRVEEENLNAIPRKQRRMTRQGLKHGLRAELGTQHLDAFWGVYAHSVHDLGSPVFPRRLFRAIADEFGKECELLTIWKEDRMVAGVLTLFYEDQVLPYYGGALREALPYAVNDFMYWELLCHAAKVGYRIFDFGRSREGTGAYHFKRHWGFEPTPLPYQYILSDGAQMPNLSPSNPKMRLAVRAWKRLPLPVTKVIGPPLTRYLS